MAAVNSNDVKPVHQDVHLVPTIRAFLTREPLGLEPIEITIVA